MFKSWILIDYFKVAVAPIESFDEKKFVLKSSIELLYPAQL